MTEAKEVLAVRRAATRAWNTLARKFHRAVETAEKTKQEMDELDRIIRTTTRPGLTA
jgi:hypothetical protein